MKNPNWWRRLFGRRWQVWFGLLLGLACLYLAARGLDLSQVGRELAAVRLPYVALALAIYLLTQLVKAIRWRWLITSRSIDMSLGQASGTLVVGQAANLLLPTRLGDIFRAYLAGENAGTSKAYMLGTIAAEKLLDMVALAVLIVVLVPFVALPSWLAARQGPVLLAAGGVAAATAALVAGRHKWVKLADWALARLPGAEGPRWQARLRSGLDGIACLANPAAALAVWWWTIVVWVLAALTNLLLFPAFRLSLGVLPAVFLLVVMQAGVAVPAAPGRVGTFHYLCMLALSVFGVPGPQALSYSLVLYFIVVGGSTAWAALVLWQRSWSLRRLAVLDT